MVRRSLFFGLTLLLIALIAALMIRGCRQEKEPSPKVVETVEQAQLSPTRVFDPQDLGIALLKTEWKKQEDRRASSYSVQHVLEIHNRGNSPYREILLRFVYRSRSGKPETRTHAIVQAVPPGTSARFSDTRLDGFPRIMGDPQVSIVYADMGTAPPPK